jgi:SAM-dependent methyltransferase
MREGPRFLILDNRSRLADAPIRSAAVGEVGEVARGGNGPSVACAICLDPAKKWGNANLRTARGKIATPISYCSGCDVFFRDMAEGVEVSHLEVAGYNRSGEGRLRRRSGLYRYLLSMVESELDDGSASLLDVGTGHGRLLEIARDDGIDVAGVEVVQRLRRGVRSELQVPCWATLDQVRGRFRAVTFVDSFQYFDDPHQTMRDLARVLDKDGLLLLRVPNRNWLVQLVHRVKPDRQFEPLADAYIGWSLRGLRRLLNEHGYRIKQVRFLDRGLHRPKKLVSAVDAALALVSRLTSISGRPISLGLIVVARRTGFGVTPGS